MTVRGTPPYGKVPMSVQMVLLPVFVQVGLTFALLLGMVFAIGIPLCVIGLAIAFFMPEYPLRDSAAVGLTDGQQPKPAAVPLH